MASSPDGIAVHFDENRGCLHLACDPETFAVYRAQAQSQIGRVFSLPFEKVREISITDIEAIAAQRAATRPRKLNSGRVALVVVVLGLAAVGAYALVMGKLG